MRTNRERKGERLAIYSLVDECGRGSFCAQEEIEGQIIDDIVNLLAFATTQDINAYSIVSRATADYKTWREATGRD